MRAWVSTLPFFVVLMGFGAIAMIVPAGFGLYLGDYTEMRVFFYGFILFGFLSLVMGLATANRVNENIARNQLLTLIAAFTLLPFMLAIPFYESLENTTMLNAWFEMVSSFTTTGATIYDNAGRLSPPLQLWRAMVGWMGGLMTWIAAFAIFAPMNLGGFEVRATSTAGRGTAHGAAQSSRISDPSERLVRFAARLAPIYVSRLVFSRGMTGENEGDWWRDPEFRIAVVLILSATVFLFLRHFVAVLDEDAPTELSDSFRAIWGALFTVASFLTTTGFESADWIIATNWSGLPTPGLLLVGMALIGGGVATTAGGVKLLRVYALFRHGEREVDRLVHPSSIGGGGREARRIRRKGAYISWILWPRRFWRSRWCLGGLRRLRLLRSLTPKSGATDADKLHPDLGGFASADPATYCGHYKYGRVAA